MLIDAHTHMPSVGWPENSTTFPSVEAAVRYLREAGTDAAIFNTWQGVLAQTEEDLERANADALALAREFNGFLYPGASIHPAFPDTSRKWLARFRDEGYLWVGELVSYKLPYKYSDLEFLTLCEECAAHRHILQLHIDQDVLQVARRFPEMPVVNSHIDVDFCPKLAEVPNVWLDISGGAGGLWIGSLEAAVKALGPDRLLYGTDFTGYEPRAFQARLQVCVPDPAEGEKIRWRNVVRLLESVGSRPIINSSGTVPFQ